MARVNQSSTGSKAPKSDKFKKAVPRKAAVSKSKSKAKAKVNSKQTKEQIRKLNQDLSTITSIHTSLSTQGQAPKEITALDVQSLREGMQKDNQTKLQSEKAEKDLASQLELITGMAL
ncbi:hypothetical protein JCM33374_g5640 [Metschnikowia sp. JCM 33374]|nr:hypothetical protein JCM33374_g5640 [Metschnikowia sp. JCM 33374]